LGTWYFLYFLLWILFSVYFFSFLYIFVFGIQKKSNKWFINKIMNMIAFIRHNFIHHMHFLRVLYRWCMYYHQF
jgi:hypothetical protein